MPSHDSQLAEGAVLGDRYRILRPLGQGGMGAVYLAEQPTLDRRVVIKVLRGDWAARPESLERFRREAGAAASLSHPNIVRVYDFRTAPGEPAYLAMEHIDGPTLEELARQEMPMDPARFMDLLQQTLSGVGAAHRAGVIHRDLKPSNILVAATASGDLVPKVIDFGLARMVDDDRMTRLTRTGQVVGSPGYMAPEQALGGDIDERTDVYALGVIAYRCLTGHYPLSGGTPAELLQALVRESPQRLRELRPDLDEFLATVIEKAVVKEPECRFDSAEGFRSAVVRWLETRGATPSGAGWTGAESTGGGSGGTTSTRPMRSRPPSSRPPQARSSAPPMMRSAPPPPRTPDAPPPPTSAAPPPRTSAGPPEVAPSRSFAPPGAADSSPLRAVLRAVLWGAAGCGVLLAMSLTAVAVGGLLLLTDEPPEVASQGRDVTEPIRSPAPEATPQRGATETADTAAPAADLAVVDGEPEHSGSFNLIDVRSRGDVDPTRLQRWFDVVSRRMQPCFEDEEQVDEMVLWTRFDDRGLASQVALGRLQGLRECVTEAAADAPRVGGHGQASFRFQWVPDAEEVTAPED